MKRTSGEQERPSRWALSRPDRLKPVPAGLSLSSRRHPPAPARMLNGHVALRASCEGARQPAIGVDPGDRLAGVEIEHMRAAAEGVDARPRAGVRLLEAPAAGKTESLGAALDELGSPARDRR